MGGILFVVGLVYLGLIERGNTSEVKVPSVPFDVELECYMTR